MVSMMKMVELINGLLTKELDLLAQALVWYDPAQAERLRNAIIVAQQEMDALENRNRQYEMMSREDETV